MTIPLILVFVFVVVMVVYTSRLMYNVAVSNSGAVIEDRILNVSSLIDTHLNTAENILHMTADSVHHMLISGSTPVRIHEFLVEETNNVAEQFNENYTGLSCFVASLLYTIQIYADFAGYSLMAIGVGKVLGFELTENFHRPYFAVSVTLLYNHPFSNRHAASCLRRWYKFSYFPPNIITS